MTKLLTPLSILIGSLIIAYHPKLPSIATLRSQLQAALADVTRKV